MHPTQHELSRIAHKKFKNFEKLLRLTTSTYVLFYRSHVIQIIALHYFYSYFKGRLGYRSVEPRDLGVLCAVFE